jgi:type II secretory pathway component PulF
MEALSEAKAGVQAAKSHWVFFLVVFLVLVVIFEGWVNKLSDFIHTLPGVGKYVTRASSAVGPKSTTTSSTTSSSTN